MAALCPAAAAPDAKGVQAFARHLQKVPDALAQTLLDGADDYDSAYEVRDHKLNQAVQMAFRAQTGDATPALAQYFGKLDLQLSGDQAQGPYLAAFAASLSRTPLASDGKQARLKLIATLKDLAAQTAALADPNSQPRSLMGAIDDLDGLLDDISHILRPQAGAPVSHQTH